MSCCGKARGIMAAVLRTDPAPEAIAQERREICLACPHAVKGKLCGICWCLIRLKTGVASEVCPLAPPKWKALPKPKHGDGGKGNGGNGGGDKNKRL